MRKIWTKQQVQANRGCYDAEQVNALSFINNAPITLIDILKSEVSIKDKQWFLVNKAQLTLGQKKQLALEFAQCVSPIYAEKYPDDKRIADCLEGIAKFLRKEITREELNALRRHCWRATYAAAYAATDAAYAAATDAAAYAAAYAATDAAYAAATNKAILAAELSKLPSYSERLLETMINFVNNNE